MAPAIEIDDEVYKRLKDEAEPFVDTPNSVLRRLLGLQTERAEFAQELIPTRSDGAELRIGRKMAKRKGSRGRRDEQGSRRVPAGSILPESEYELPLLEALIDAGGQAPSKEVTEAVGRKLAGRLTDLDREPLKSGGIRWENRIQFVRLKMIERGLMIRDTPRGIWAISDDGRRQLELSQ
ncbi:MAG TPA: winged helix-turn-helix domain-containing protein [Acidimicrobiia bacterium]|nr:winged helix-turn-helix domain-containing protein [Acidimicrobiia bacterium]